MLLCLRSLGVFCGHAHLPACLGHGQKTGLRVVAISRCESCQVIPDVRSRKCRGRLLSLEGSVGKVGSTMSLPNGLSFYSLGCRGPNGRQHGYVERRGGDGEGRLRGFHSFFLFIFRKSALSCLGTVIMDLREGVTVQFTGVHLKSAEQGRNRHIHGSESGGRHWKMCYYCLQGSGNRPELGDTCTAMP